MKTNSPRNHPNQNSAKQVPGPANINQITDFPNGLSIPGINLIPDSQSAFKYSNNIGLNPQFKLNKGFKPRSSFENTSYLNNDTQSYDTRKHIEREMPNLVREFDTDQRSSLLTGSTIFNQRYQNVRQFPNYRHRKKVAFERKLKRCGLELDGEVTISILRQFLQPFIYRDINSILDEYINKYFMKAFLNIRENINITSENWSKIIKCNISKSLYKQYCTNATINPFDPMSVELTDFPCFPNLCKVSNSTNQKSSTVQIDVQIKSDIDDSTVPDVASDNNSEFSTLSDHYDINQIDIVQPINHCSQKSDDCPDSYHEPYKLLCRKRNIETNKILDNNLKAPNFNGSSHKFSKKLHSIQSINNCHVPNLLGHSNDISLANHSQLQAPNNYQALPNNLSKTSYDPIRLKTAPFDIKDFSFSKDSSLNLSIVRNPSQSAMQSGNYLNLSHNSIENNDRNDRYFQRT